MRENTIFKSYTVSMEEGKHLKSKPKHAIKSFNLKTSGIQKPMPIIGHARNAATEIAKSRPSSITIAKCKT